MGNWKAKRSHDRDRVDTYSNPYIDEVIYPDEWEKKRRNKDKRKGFLADFIDYFRF